MTNRSQRRVGKEEEKYMKDLDIRVGWSVAERVGE